jgi:hypothetical protein
VQVCLFVHIIFLFLDAPEQCSSIPTSIHVEKKVLMGPDVGFERGGGGGGGGGVR